MTNVRRKKGQAIVLVTLALIAMCGLMGLAVDMGWSFYVEKTSQAAADSSALAVVLEVLKLGGKLGPYNPGITRTNAAGASIQLVPNSTSRFTCPSTLPSTSSGTINHNLIGCLYAARNGFGASANTQTNVGLTWGNTSPAPEVPDVAPVYYWATAYVAQRIPQLFSAVLGNTEGLVASKATAAIIDSESNGSLILLNREHDCVKLETGGNVCDDRGTNLLVQANANCPPGQSCVDPYSLRVGGGVIAASQANGTRYPQDEIALVALGGSQVEAQYYAIRGVGTYYEDNNANFGPNNPQNGFSGSMFEDPTTGMPNPPLGNPVGRYVYNDGGNDGVIPGGPDAANATPILPGIYAATAIQGGQRQMTANPIRLTGGYYKFVDSSGTAQTSFSDYTFIGGLSVSSQAVVSLSPGKYVMMGAKQQGSNAGNVLQIVSGAVVDDGLTANQAAPSGNPGQLFVLAGPNYEGAPGDPYDANSYVSYAQQQLFTTNGNTAAAIGIRRGKVDIQLGNSGNPLVNIHGLNPDTTTALDTGGTLEGFRRFVMWQDRDNSMIDYDRLGNINLASCPSPCADPLDYAAPNPDLASMVPESVGLTIQASPAAHIYGVVYQPRGAFTAMVGGGGYSGPLQIVTGAFRVQGNSTLNLGVLDYPLVTRIVSLIQ